MVLRVCRKKERPVENSFVVVFGESSVQLYASSFVLFTTATTRQRNHCDIPPSLGIRILCYFVFICVFLCPGCNNYATNNVNEFRKQELGGQV